MEMNYLSSIPKARKMILEHENLHVKDMHNQRLFMGLWQTGAEMFHCGPPSDVLAIHRDPSKSSNGKCRSWVSPTTILRFSAAILPAMTELPNATLLRLGYARLKSPLVSYSTVKLSEQQYLRLNQSIDEERH